MKSKEAKERSREEALFLEDFLLELALLEQGACDFFALQTRASQRAGFCQEMLESSRSLDNESLQFFWQTLLSFYQKIAFSEDPEELNGGLLDPKEISKLNSYLETIIAL